MKNTTPNKIIERNSADCTMLIQHSMRADGAWFVRHQIRDPRFGYRWGAWKPGFAPDYGRDTGRKARLPKSGIPE